MKVSLKNLRPTKNIREPDTSLAPSLKTHGQKNPILAYRNLNVFIIKDGHRRFYAAQELGWEDLELTEIDPPEDQTDLLMDMLIINKHRKEISYLEEARVYLALRDAGLTQHEIAKRLSVSDADVSLALSLLNADQRIQDAVNNGRISSSAIEPLLSLPPDMQAELVPAAIRCRTVRNVKRLVDAAKRRITDDERDEDGQAVPEDVDPLEALAIAELQEAETHVSNAVTTPLTHPALVRQAKKIGANLRQLLGAYA
jgi:ParB family chromosome partitioning protein